MLYQIVINSSLKHHTFILLQLWRLEFQNECQSCQQGWLFLEAPGRICACLFQHPEAASISWLLTPPSHQSGLCFPLIKTPGDFQPPDCYESPLVSGFGSWQPWQIGRGEERKTWKDMSRILVCSALVSWNSHRQRKSVPSGHFFFFGVGVAYVRFCPLPPDTDLANSWFCISHCSHDTQHWPCPSSPSIHLCILPSVLRAHQPPGLSSNKNSRYPQAKRAFTSRKVTA